MDEKVVKLYRLMIEFPDNYCYAITISDSDENATEDGFCVARNRLSEIKYEVIMFLKLLEGTFYSRFQGSLTITTETI